MLSPTIVVIGAGPAGSTAARLLASDGARVTLVEARALPREKTCAGGLTAKALRWIPATALLASERSIHKYEFRGGRLPPFRLDRPDAEIIMVQRATFDQAMAEAAAAAGAVVHDAERVLRVEEREDGVRVTTQRGVIRADYLVAADGEPSMAARDLGLGGAPVRRSLALSAKVPLSSAISDDTVSVSFSVDQGFAWYFPKRDHASVGAGSALSSEEPGEAARLLRDELSRFAEDAGFGLDGAHLTGHWIPQGIRRGRLVSNRSLLAGDAAGMADPLFGEGIAYAIGTGYMAAQSLGRLLTGRASSLASYEARLRAAYGAPMRRLGFAARVVDRSPSLALMAARLCPWIRAYGANVVSGRHAPFSFRAAVDPDAQAVMPPSA